MPWIEHKLRLRRTTDTAPLRWRREQPSLSLDAQIALCELFVKWYDGTGVFEHSDMSLYSLISNADLADLSDITDKLEPYGMTIRAFLRTSQHDYD